VTDDDKYAEKKRERTGRLYNPKTKRTTTLFRKQQEKRKKIKYGIIEGPAYGTKSERGEKSGNRCDK